MFADHQQFQRLREVGNRADHLVVELAAGHAFDEAALDLDEVDRQMAQVRE